MLPDLRGGFSRQVRRSNPPHALTPGLGHGLSQSDFYRLEGLNRPDGCAAVPGKQKPLREPPHTGFHSNLFSRQRGQGRAGSLSGRGGERLLMTGTPLPPPAG